MDKQRPQPFRDIDSYIAAAPENAREKLEQVRQTIKKAAPKAEETISYGMPAFKQNGILVYFASFKNHIGFFPTASGVSHFKKELKDYAVSKGTIRFPLNDPIPLDLIVKIVKFRVEETTGKGKKQRPSQAKNE